MTSGVYRFLLKPDVPLDEAEMSLQLAILAAEGLFGGARVRMEAVTAGRTAARPARGCDPEVGSGSSPSQLSSRGVRETRFEVGRIEDLDERRRRFTDGGSGAKSGGGQLTSARVPLVSLGQGPIAAIPPG
jgi:hypothetical protein